MRFIPRGTEIRQIDDAVEAVTKQHNISTTEISTSEINEIVQKIGIININDFF